MIPSPELAILCFLATRTHASAPEIGISCRMTAAEVRARLVMLESMRLVAGRRDPSRSAARLRHHRRRTAEGGAVIHDEDQEAEAAMTGFDDDTPMTLDEAAEVLLRGVVTASTLRAAIGRHELSYERIGRRIMVTPADIRAWRERCRIPARDRPISASAHGRSNSTLISPAHVEAQQALTRAVLDDLAKLKPRTGKRRCDARPQKDRG